MADISRITPSIANPSLSQTDSARAARNLRDQVHQDQASGGDPKKIEKSARDFESILVGQWLEQAEKTFATVPGGDPDQQNDSGHDQFQSIATQALASSLTKAGGLGIATMITKQLKAQTAGIHEGHGGAANGNTAGPSMPRNLNMGK